MHAGSIRADSAGVGRGATFTVRLPLNAIQSDSPLPSERSVIRDVLAATAVPNLLQDVHALVVEDDDDARDLMIMVLKYTGAEITAVKSAEEAVAALDRTEPDVLVSDMGLPGEDGYALVRKVRLRKPEDGGNIPAVAVTAWASDDDRQRAIAAGFQAHVSKPIDASFLLNTIASLVGRGTSERSDTVSERGRAEE